MSVAQLRGLSCWWLMIAIVSRGLNWSTCSARFYHRDCATSLSHGFSLKYSSWERTFCCQVREIYSCCCKSRRSVSASAAREMFQERQRLRRCSIFFHYQEISNIQWFSFPDCITCCVFSPHMPYGTHIRWTPKSGTRYWFRHRNPVYPSALSSWSVFSCVHSPEPGRETWLQISWYGQSQTRAC